MIRAFLKKVGLLPNKSTTSSGPLSHQGPVIIPRSEHGISRTGISENALKVLYRLHKHGFGAYLVGGGVRDLLLGLHPKDFDVVTDATPDEVRRVFRNCRLIGRRFRLAHVFFGSDIVEVATFRGKMDEPSDDISHSDKGMILRDNVYGNIAQDVWRRDFTINALYYNIADFSIVDYTGGYADIKAKRMRMIGQPHERYREDPVRMLRAVRFACKVGFELPKELVQPMIEMKELIGHVSAARLFEEMMKMFHSGAAHDVYEHLLRNELFGELFPVTNECLQQPSYPTHELLKIVFENTDKRIKEQKPVTPSFIVAALLWHPICVRAEQYMKDGMTFFPARMLAIEDMIRAQAKRISIPKRIVQGARDIWLLQMRLVRRHGKKVQLLMTEARFRAAFDFLEIRAKSGEPVQDLATWWKEYIEGDNEIRRNLIKSLGQKKTRRPRRKKSDTQHD
ncbi:MAG: polynucleotide adenylyltransferase PcnB [Gammaproteobacteria bacterium]|nr:polynucleotide adenylyltransferase PcnB [Gammaproteobacteria bacterium]